MYVYAMHCIINDWENVFYEERETAHVSILGEDRNVAKVRGHLCNIVQQIRPFIPHY